MNNKVHIRGLVKRNEIWWVRKMVDGVLIQKSTRTKDQHEAFRRMAEMLASPRLRYSGGGNSFEVLIPKFIHFKTKTGTFSRFSKREKMGILWRIARDIGTEKDINEITEKKVIDTLTSGRFEKLKPATRNTYLMALKSFFTWAYRFEKAIPTNTIEAIQPFKELKASNRMRLDRELFLVAEEMRFLIWVAFCCQDFEVAYILIMGFSHGLRRNEICESRSTWFDFERGIITVEFLGEDEAESIGLDDFSPKWGKSRDIPIDPIYRPFLEWYAQGKDYCLAPQRRRSERSRYRYDFQKKYSNFMGYVQMGHITIHGMRHSYASNLSRQGKPLCEIASYLGDSQRVTENHYLHHQPSSKEFPYLYGDALIQARQQKLAELWKTIRTNKWLNSKSLALPEEYSPQSPMDSAWQNTPRIRNSRSLQ